MLVGYGFAAKKEKTQIMSSDREQESLNIRLNRRVEATTRFLQEVDDLATQVPSSDKTLVGKRSYVRYLKS